MVIDIVLYILTIGLVGLLKLRAREDRILSWLMFFAFTSIGYLCYQQNIDIDGSGFSLLWSTSDLGDVTLDFHLLHNANQTITSLYLISLLVILNNNLFRYEEKRSSFNSFIIFNFISLSLIICAQNYVQLITMVFVSDILGYLILKNVDSSHRYVIYNFFADMILFMILALACGKINSLELTSLLGYDQIGRHKDFVGLMTALALFIKIGCFPFQSYLCDIYQARFQRMSVVCLLTAPLAGILVLLKLHNLLLVSDQFLPVYKIIVFLTFCVGIAGLIIQRDIQKKMVHFNLASIAILLGIIGQNGFTWDISLSLSYMAIYLFNNLFFQIYLYQNRENDILKMVNAQKFNTRALKTLLIQTTILASISTILLWNIAHNLGNMSVLWGGVILFLALSIILSHVYQSTNVYKVGIMKPNGWRNFAFVVNSILLILGIYYAKEEINYIIILSAIFLGLISLPIGKYTKKVYENSKIQEKEISNNFFAYCIVKPIKYVGRTFWLMIDSFLSEKLMTTLVTRVERMGIGLFLMIHKQKLARYILFLLLGFSIFMIAYMRSFNQ